MKPFKDNVLVCGKCSLPVGNKDTVWFKWSANMPSQALNVYVVMPCCGALKPLFFSSN